MDGIGRLEPSERKRSGFEIGKDLAFRTETKLQSLSKDSVIFLVAMRPGDTPVPIPNTMVKTRAADGTALETMWESRWLPDQKK